MMGKVASSVAEALGAVAPGHTRCASDARLATTAANRRRATRGRYTLCTMCIDVGQGVALILENA